MLSKYIIGGFCILSLFSFSFLIYLNQLNEVESEGDFLVNQAPFGTNDYVNESDKWIFRNFIIANSDYCKYVKNLEVLVLVHSSLTHFQMRSIIRQNVPINYKAIFLLGHLTDPGLQQSIEEESSRFSDIVQGNFYDTYRNLTVKHIMGLTWARKYCSNAVFVLKIDDDIFINYSLLNQLIEVRFPKPKYDQLITRTGYKLIACFVHRNMKVIRNETNKWFVSRNEFSGTTFPDFCSGWGYLTTIEVISGLLNQVTKHQPYFWIDDVYITGILRKSECDVQLEYWNKWYNVDVSYLYEWIQSGHVNYKWRYIFSNTNGDSSLLETSYQMNKICSQRSDCLCCYPTARTGTSQHQAQAKSSIGIIRKIKL